MLSIKRLLLAFGIFLCALPLQAQFNYLPAIQSSVGTTSSCIFPKAVTSGDIIIASSSWETGTATPSVTDTVLSSYGQQLLNTANNVKISIYTATAASSGSDTIVFSVAGAAFQNTVCAEFPPLWTLTADGTATSATFSGTPATVTSPSLTTTQNSDLIYSHIGGFRSAGGFGSGAGDYFTGYTGGNDSEAAEYLLPGVNGAYTTSFKNITNDQGTIGIIALKSTSGITIQSPASLPDGALTKAYNYTLLATGGTGAYTWSITSGGLQSGLSLNTSTGAITGTPTTGPTNTITFHVTDGSATANLTATLKVSSSLNTITDLQDKTNAGTGSLAFNSNVTSGSLIVVTVGSFYGNPVSTFGEIGGPCTDTLTTTFHLIGDANIAAPNNTAGTNDAFVFAGIAPSGGADTVACPNDIRSISEFSNAGYFGNDNLALTSGSGGGTITSNSLTTLVPNEVLYGVASGFTTASSLTVQSPFTAINSAVNTATGYDVVTTVTGYTVSSSMASNTDGRWTIILGGFRPTGGAAAPGSNFRHQLLEH